MLAPVFELEPGADHELPHRARHQDLPRRGRALHPLPDMHPEAADVASRAVDLAGMEPRADIETELLHRLADRVGAANRARRA